MWDSIVDLLRASIFSATHLTGGSLGAAILIVSAVIRLALLPLSLRMARQARAQQLRLAALKPALDRIQQRHANNPALRLKETQALYQTHNIRLLSPTSLMSLAIQAPLLGALFSAVRQGLGAGVRFLWIGDLARPDLVALSIVAALTAAVVGSAPVAPGQPATPTVAWVMFVGTTLVFAWSASSAVALSMGAGSLVSVLQNWILARDARPAIAARRG